MEEQKKPQSKKQQNKRLKECNIHLDLVRKLGLDIPKENKYVIPIFIPHRGCKNECVFCNQKKISGEMRNVLPKDVKNEIESWLNSFSDKSRPVQVAFFGGSFTGLSLDEQESFLKVAYEYIKTGMVNSIKLSTRPDYIDEENLKLLKKYNVECIELGVQSMADDVLLASKRGHDSKDVVVASKVIKKFGFKLGHQVMVGLPCSTKEKEIQTIKACLKLKPDVIRIYPVYVLKESKLYDMALTKEYIPLSLEDAIDRTKAVYKECVKHKANVIRIGLQTTEEITIENEDILGPVCNNYKERVLSSIAMDEIEKKLAKVKKCDRLNLIVPDKVKNFVIGNGKENISYIQSVTNAKVKVKNKN